MDGVVPLSFISETLWYHQEVMGDIYGGQGTSPISRIEVPTPCKRGRRACLPAARQRHGSGGSGASPSLPLR